MVVIYTRDLYIARVLDVCVAAHFLGLFLNELVKHTSPNGLYAELFRYNILEQTLKIQFIFIFLFKKFEKKDIIIKNIIIKN